MKISLTGKLTLAFLLVALTATLLVALVMRLYSAEQLNQLVIDQQRSEYKELLEEYYLANGSFKGIGELLWRGEGQERPGPGSQDEFDPSKTRRRDYSYFLPDRKGNLFGIANARGVVILPLIPHFPPGARVPGLVLGQAEPVEVEGVTVAYILTAPNPPDFTPAERAF